MTKTQRILLEAKNDLEAARNEMFLAQHGPTAKFNKLVAAFTEKEQFVADLEKNNEWLEMAEATHLLA